MIYDVTLAPSDVQLRLTADTDLSTDSTVYSSIYTTYLPICCLLDSTTHGWMIIFLRLSVPKMSTWVFKRCGERWVLVIDTDWPTPFKMILFSQIWVNFSFELTKRRTGPMRMSSVIPRINKKHLIDIEIVLSWTDHFLLRCYHWPMSWPWRSYPWPACCGFNSFSNGSQQTRQSCSKAQVGIIWHVGMT